MKEFKTVLGTIPENELGVVLPHEHIFCYSEYVYKMIGKKYFDKELLFPCAVQYLKKMKEKYNLNTYIDCTPVNIGRDIEMLKRVSEKSGVNIICSTGFYYTQEALFCNTQVDTISEYIISDALNINAGIIKCAVESESISPINEKLIRAASRAQRSLNLPIVMHTNSRNKNAKKALEIVLSEGVKPQAVTVAHLSDTEDFEYIKYFAECGCYIGYDRLYEKYEDEYISNKVKAITRLYDCGYGNRILLSHDSLFFSGFSVNPQINEKPRLNYLFDNILPKLPEEIVRTVTTENPLNMLKMI